MTLKELLTQVGFDELLPDLEKHEPEHLDNLYAFREAYTTFFVTWNLQIILKVKSL